MTDFVYLIHDVYSKAYKIGVSNDPYTRLKALQTSNPRGQLRLVTFIYGSYDLEKKLHLRFSLNRINGEWFEECEDILNYFYDFDTSIRDFQNNPTIYPEPSEQPEKLQKLQTQLFTDPTDINKIVSILESTTSLTKEQSIEAVDNFVPIFLDIYKKFQILIENNDSGKINALRLASYFLNNPKVIADFNVERTTSKWLVTYKGKSDNLTMTEAYNILTRNLFIVFGTKSMSHSTFENAIVKAFHWGLNNNEN